MTYEPIIKQINLDRDPVILQVGLLFLSVYLDRLEGHNGSNHFDKLDVAFGLSDHAITEVQMIGLDYFLIQLHDLTQVRETNLTLDFSHMNVQIDNLSVRDKLFRQWEELPLHEMDPLGQMQQLFLVNFILE